MYTGVSGRAPLSTSRRRTWSYATSDDACRRSEALEARLWFEDALGLPGVLSMPGKLPNDGSCHRIDLSTQEYGDFPHVAEFPTEGGNMNLAFFPCCISAAFLEKYETATRVVMAELGIEVQSRRDFNCCGYPLKGCNYGAYIHLSAKNLALAEKYGFYLFTPCGCCYGSLKHVETLLKQNSCLRDDVNSALAGEGLEYAGTTAVKHVLEVLLENVGIEKLQTRLEKRYQGVKVATHYGCHLLRPRKIVNFDNPFRPVKFDQLVEATGAESIPWSEKLECCGAPLLGVNDTVALSLTR